MATPTYELEYELEGLHEWEGEQEGEWEFEQEMEHEGESEQEQFFGRLGALTGRAVRSPALRRIGLAAARAALANSGATGEEIRSVLRSLLAEQEQELEGEFEYEFEGELEGEFEGELEGELEGESEYEFEGGQGELYSAAMMEHIGALASEAQSEQEMEQFLPFLLPLAMKAAPMLMKAAPKLLKAAPRILRGVRGVGRMLFRNPGTRPLLRTLPRIVRGTVNQLGQGGSVSPSQVRRAIARNTLRVIGNPRRAARAFRRSRLLDRRFHRGVNIRIGPIITGGRCPRCGRRRR